MQNVDELKPGSPMGLGARVRAGMVRIGAEWMRPRNLLALLMLCAAIGASSAWGQSCTAGGQSPGEPGCAGVGNPLNVMAGNKYQREEDMPALPGVLGLELVRHYNSDFSAWWPGVAESSSPVGRGWRLSYEAALRLPQGAGGKRARPGNIGAEETLYFHSADGTQIALTQTSRDALSGRSEWHGAGTAWRLRIDPADRVTPYVLSDAQGLQRHFDAMGRLMRIRAASGHAVHIDRDTHGRILRVFDPQGRYLQLHYPETAVAAGGKNGKNRPRVVRQAQYIDTPLGRYSYHYGHEAHAASDRQAAGALTTLAQIQAQASSLMRVELPGGGQRHYHYEIPEQASLLTGISVRASASAALEREVSWAYDPVGRAVRSVKGAIPAAGQRGPHDVQLRFLGPQGQQKRDGSGVTILSNSLGEETRYEYEMIAGRRQLTLVQGAGCGTCGPVNVRYGYDSLGRQTEITELSPVLVKGGQAQTQAQPLRTQRLHRDPQGRILRIEHTLYSQGRVVRTEWVQRRDYADPRWPHKPTLIARPSVVQGQEHRLQLSYNEAGQLEQARESGYSPLDAHGDLAATAQQATPIERISRWRYQKTLDGQRSLLVEADGPLPNGPLGSPMDSDITRWQWDEKGNRLLVVTHPMGLFERFEYDKGPNASGRVIARTDALGTRTEIDWQTHAMRISQISRAGVQVSFDYDGRGRVSRLRRNDGVQIAVAHDDAQGLARYTLPDGEIREIRSDSEGRLSTDQWLDAQGHALVAPRRVDYGELDMQGLRQISLTDASGVLTRWQADPLQSSVRSQRGQGQAQLEHTERFDAARHLLQIQRNETVTEIQVSDQDAQRSLTLPHGAQHRQWQDDFGRTVRIEHPDSGLHRATWDQADRQTSRWDAHRHSSARYDALGRLIQLRHTHTDSAPQAGQEEETTTWHYQGALLVRQTSHWQDTHYTYDAHGRLIEQRLRLRRQSADTAQNVTDATAWLPEQTTRYERDGIGRIARVRLPEGATLTQRYNAQGRIEAVRLQAPAVHWWQRLIRWVWADQGSEEIIGQIQHSASRGLQGWRHGNGAQATSAHNHAGRLERWSDGPLQSELGYNEHAQLARLKTAAPAQLGALPMQAAAQRPQTLTTDKQLGYDPFGRLRQVQEQNPAGEKSEAFRYDPNGNRLAQQAPTLDWLHYQMADHGDRLLAVRDPQGRSQRSYQYNQAGEPIRIQQGENGGQRTLHYDAQGQIGAVEENGQPLASYAYNGARQRVAKTVRNGAQQEGTSTTTYYTWHGGLLDAELDARGRVQRRYIYLNLRPVALIEYDYPQGQKTEKPSRVQRYAIHTDHLGTPQALTDQSQRVIWLARYDAFGRAQTRGLPRGQLVVHNGARESGWMGTAHASAPAAAGDKPFEFNLRFAGQYEDAETGWHYNWQRYYEPEAGRYLTPDPIGLGGGDNAYGYAGADPLGAVDPDGLLVVISGHRAAGSFGGFTSPVSYHLSIVMIPDDPAAFANESGWLQWTHGAWGGATERHSIYRAVGGQAQGLSIFNPPMGNLVRAFNYVSDGPGASTFSWVVPTPAGMSDSGFICAIIASASRYRDNQKYSLPSSSGHMPNDEYNSNSFVSGVFADVMGSPPTIVIPSHEMITLNHGFIVRTWVYDFQIPGYNNPLPMR